MSTAPIQIGSYVTPIGPISSVCLDRPRAFYDSEDDGTEAVAGAKYEVLEFHGAEAVIQKPVPHAERLLVQLADLELW